MVLGTEGDRLPVVWLDSNPVGSPMVGLDRSLSARAAAQIIPDPLEVLWVSEGLMLREWVHCPDIGSFRPPRKQINPTIVIAREPNAPPP